MNKKIFRLKTLEKVEHNIYDKSWGTELYFVSVKYKKLPKYNRICFGRNRKLN